MKRLTALLLALTLALALTACGGKTPDPAPAAPPAAEPAGTPAAPETDPAPETPDDAVTYPLTLTDMAGRTVTIPSEPQKIVSGYYISSSACVALGLKARMVGVEDKSDKRPIYKLAAPELIDKVNVGSAKAFDLEACVAAEPDLVILPQQRRDTADTLAEMGVPALVVVPESHEQILEMFALIGQAANVKAAAQALSSYYTGKLEAVEAMTQGIAQDARPVVYMAGTSGYLRTSPKDMYQSSLISAAGGVNAGDGIEGSNWVDISYEQLLSMDPEVIVIPTNNFATSAPDYTAADVLADPQLSGVRAVKSGAVYEMPTGFEAWDSPAPSGILGTLWMLKTLHPEVYSGEQFASDVGEFYETFYGFTPDTASLSK